jgi:hypothetical protein
MNTSSIFAFLPLDIKEEVVEHLFEDDVRKNKDILDVDFKCISRRALFDTMLCDYAYGAIGLCDTYEHLQECNDDWYGSRCIIPSFVKSFSRMKNYEWIESLPEQYVLSDNSYSFYSDSDSYSDSD